MTFIESFFSFLLAILQTLLPMMGINTGMYFTNWSEDTVYTREYAVELQKNPNKDFVILNLTDIQLSAGEQDAYAGKLAKATVDKLVQENNPDLITLTGDNAWSTETYKALVKLIDGYGIPWAPVMGNHDGQGCVSEKWCAKQFVKAKHCLFRFGPKGMGYGNYILNITENGQIIHSLFMMDSHSDIEEDNINGPKSDCYDHFWSQQLKWYAWAVNGIAQTAGKTVESTVFMHIPVVEYKTAWAEAYDTNKGCYRENYAQTSFGVNHENVCCAPQNNGFFTLCKTLGSTKNMVCGHDHVNTSSILYDGIRLTYGVKTGMGCYWEADMNGGTTVTLSSGGTATVSHVYIAPDSLGISEN